MAIKFTKGDQCQKSPPLLPPTSPSSRAAKESGRKTSVAAPSRPSVKPITTISADKIGSLSSGSQTGLQASSAPSKSQDVRPAVKPSRTGFDRNAYQREYMRAWRKRRKDKNHE